MFLLDDLIGQRKPWLMDFKVNVCGYANLLVSTVTDFVIYKLDLLARAGDPMVSAPGDSFSHLYSYVL
jgi:hypothetical protein